MQLLFSPCAAGLMIRWNAVQQDKPAMTLPRNSVSLLKVYYTINEQAYIAFMKRFASESAGLEEARKLRIELVLGDGSLYPQTGRFYAIDRQVDVRTGTLRVAALFPNPTNLLRPGQFVRVRVLIGTKRRSWSRNGR